MTSSSVLRLRAFSMDGTLALGTGHVTFFVSGCERPLFVVPRSTALNKSRSAPLLLRSLSSDFRPAPLTCSAQERSKDYLSLFKRATDHNPSLSLFLFFLVCIHQGYLRTDISGIDQASSFHFTHISLSFTVLYHSRQFLCYLTCKCR